MRARAIHKDDDPVREKRIEQASNLPMTAFNWLLWFADVLDKNDTRTLSISGLKTYTLRNTQMSSRETLRRKSVLPVTVVRGRGAEKQVAHTLDVTGNSARLAGL